MYPSFYPPLYASAYLPMPPTPLSIPTQYYPTPEPIHLDPVPSFELKFDNLYVVAQVQQDIQIAPQKFQKREFNKVILNNISSIFRPSTFTAIIGPSGCGKTTMLNLLLGRLTSSNLELGGQLYVNGRAVDELTPYDNMIGYILQEDLLLATFTPRESFRFVADLRLIECNEEQKVEKVEELIKILGLVECADTYIGNTLIRGISGGEKRRTSIGVQLLTNPSIIFLDEPTTGLDSTTALNLMMFLNEVTKNGRTIVSTIHQPSSQIFNQFDELILMVQGNIVYQGKAQDSMGYFRDLSFEMSRRSNPTDYYMRIMNKEGITLEFIDRGLYADEITIKQMFRQRVEYFKEKYYMTQHNFNPSVVNEIRKYNVGTGQGNIHFCGQVYYIMKRAMINQIRNPLDLILRAIQVIILSVFCALLYYQKSDQGFAHLMNIKGCLSFIVSAVAFVGMVSHVATFNVQRSVFIRQKMNNTYSIHAYYFGRTIGYIPIEILMPFFMLLIGYFSSNLDNSADTFFLQLLTVELLFWMSTSYSLFISASVQDFTAVLGIISTMLIPCMLLSGYFINLRQVPDFFKWLEYLNPFKYGYQAMIYNQFRKNPVVDCGNGVLCNVLDVVFNFEDKQWVNYVLMAAIGLALRALAYVSLACISTPKKSKVGRMQEGEMGEEWGSPYGGTPRGGYGKYGNPYQPSGNNYLLGSYGALITPFTESIQYPTAYKPTMRDALNPIYLPQQPQPQYPYLTYPSLTSLPSITSLTPLNNPISTSRPLANSPQNYNPNIPYTPSVNINNIPNSRRIPRTSGSRWRRILGSYQPGIIGRSGLDITGVSARSIGTVTGGSLGGRRVQVVPRRQRTTVTRTGLDFRNGGYLYGR